MSDGFKETGDWETVGKTLKMLQKTFDKVGDEPLKKCGELYLNLLKSKIEGQSLPWTPLSQYYLEYKIKKGLDTRVLIATGDYLSQLKVQEVKGSSKGKQLFVGASPNDIHKPSGLSMEKIAQILEYGRADGKMPARPHFRPSWEEARPKCKAIWLSIAREIRWKR